MPDADDVMGVLTEQIQNRFQMPIAELRRTAASTPQASPEATTIVHWYGLLTEAQQVLDRAEEALAEALAQHTEAVPDDEFVELPDHVVQLANTVNSAHGVREGRAMTLRYLLYPQAIGHRSPGAWRGAGRATRRGSALPATAPSLPIAAQAPVRGGAR
ncbi:hypothetical protein [Streptomyces neyagawaensis]|uniref:hypothetical protein n=1 Tax=Streptomyces neyagawaensis TaxID=42238 RepID=UPI0006E16018|nr:hypothetical protein [Streptomyces neyagawaensis]MCL6739429.1 hypothetical protein [Streptomyces neyagawaensis]MDE1688339.1 hypothetical protein [Streptomyces neyagawaensis]MDG5808503.1 hypothetical protein [Streptomyces ossamyceticus]